MSLSPESLAREALADAERYLSCLKVIEQAGVFDNYTDAHRARMEQSAIQMRSAEREPALARAYLEASERIGRMEKALIDAIRTWTFNDHQHHTHSWHDREDWFERHEVAREIRKALGRGRE